ncbi:MAG: PilN domain-containing protein [Pseudomonadota bacterium]
MIRINLLPIRAFRKKENIRRQVSIYVLTVLFSLGLMGYFLTSLGRTVDDLTGEKEALVAQEAELKKKVKEVNDLKKESEELSQKVLVISGLEKSRRGPVKLLDEISLRTPRDRVWLESLEHGKNRPDQINLTGTAVDNESLALFMSNLEQSGLFSGVGLVRSQSKGVKGLNLKQFSIQCTLKGAGGETKPADGKV